MRKIEDDKTKQDLYEVFKKSVVKLKVKKTINPYNLNEILRRFDHQSPKEVSIKELLIEVKQYRKEIKDLREFTSLGLSDLQGQINRIVNSQENLMDLPESSQVNDEETKAFFNTVSRVIFQMWEVPLTIVIKEKFVLDIIALVYSGAAENCLQEGLVPISLCEETNQSLFGANGKRLVIKYKLTDANIHNHDVCIKQTFILVKDLKEKALLGIPFLSTIYPLWVDNKGIRANFMDKEILFEFANPPISINPCNQDINLVRIDVPPRLMGNQLIHNCINDILRISLSISKFQIGILNQEFLLKIDFESDKTTKYIIFKHYLINWYIILSSNFQGKFIKGKYSIPNQPSREFCRVHEIMAPKKNTQAPKSQKSQSNQANQSPSPHKMLWSQQVEQEEKEAQLLAKLHSSKPMHESNYMPNKMLTLYYDHSDHSKPVKVTQYPAISGSQTFKQITMANPSQKELATISSTSKQIVVAANPTPLSIKSRYWQNDLNQPLLAIEREFFF